MRFFFLLMMCCLAGHLPAQMQQVFVDSDNNNSVRKIQFLSESEGFVAFDKWIGYSKDSGRTFTRKFVTTSNVNYNGYGVNLTFGFAIKGVYAFSNSWLLVYGHYGFVPAILSSTDGGNSFTLVYQADTNPAYLYRGVLDMFFSGYTGYAVTDDRVLKTTNRGLSWATVCINNNADFLHLNFFDGVKGIAVAQSKILKTLNGGSSWQSISTPSDYIRSASFLNDQKGWLSIGGLIYRTTTGGNSWEKMNNEDAPVAGTVLRFQNDSIGYTNGDTYTLLKTTDGGKYWQKLRRTNRFSYLGYIHESLFFLNHNQYWAGGGHGFLELTTNGGGESVPVAAFVIDYSDLSTTNTVRLLNKSKPGSAFTWYRNQTILSTSYDAAYVSNREGVDTIRLIVRGTNLSDTAEQLFDTRAHTTYYCNPAFTQQVDTSTISFFASDSTWGASHTWYFGNDNRPFTGLRGTYQFDSVGEYQVKHVVSSAIYGCRDSAIQTIYVARTRKCLFLDFTWTADTFYTNRLVFNPGFSKRHESGTIAMSIKEWNWGDGKPIENNTIHEFDKPGLYTVCMTAQNYYTGCISSNCKAVPVFMDTTCKADFLVSFSNYSNETTFIGKPAVRTNGVRNSWAIDNRPIVHTGNASVFQTEFHQLRRGEGRYFDYIGYDCSNGTSKEISLDSLERTITRIVYDSIKGCSDTFTRTIAIPRQKNVFIKVTRLPSSPLSLRFSAYEVRYPGDTAEFPHSGRWRIDRPGGTTFIGSYSSSYPQDWTFPYAGNFSVSISVNPCDWLAQREVYVLHFTLPVLTNRWTGRVSKAWEDPHNWILGVVPDDATDVIIEKGVVEVNAAARCRTLINRTGANIKVKNGGSLVVLQ